jgi:hypothetical protein
MMRELSAKEVLADLLGSDELGVEIADPERAAEIVIKWLNDAGFQIVAID